jgi:hypothetical protein
MAFGETDMEELQTRSSAPSEKEESSVVNDTFTEGAASSVVAGTALLLLAGPVAGIVAGVIGGLVPYMIPLVRRAIQSAKAEGDSPETEA